MGVGPQDVLSLSLNFSFCSVMFFDIIFQLTALVLLCLVLFLKSMKFLYTNHFTFIFLSFSSAEFFFSDGCFFIAAGLALGHNIISNLS